MPIHIGSESHEGCEEEGRGVTGYGKVFDCPDDTVEKAKTQEQREKRPTFPRNRHTDLRLENPGRYAISRMSVIAFLQHPTQLLRSD
jgi:hypothetical protein